MNSIAVIIPVFNKAIYLDRCIQSMILQPELADICIIDDGSTDGSIDIIKSYLSQDNRVRLLQHDNQENRGRSASRNLGIKSTSCEWISFCDADDYYEEGRYKAFCASGKDLIDGTHEVVMSKYTDDKFLKAVDLKTAAPINLETPKDLQNYLIAHREERISIISLIIKKSRIKEIGYFDESLESGEDTDLIWRLAGTSKLKYINQNHPKVIRQVHHENSYQNKETLNRSRFIFYKKWKVLKDGLNLSKEAQERINSSYNFYAEETNQSKILKAKRMVRNLKKRLL